MTEAYDGREVVGMDLHRLCVPITSATWADAPASPSARCRVLVPGGPVPTWPEVR